MMVTMMICCLLDSEFIHLELEKWQIAQIQKKIRVGYGFY